MTMGMKGRILANRLAEWAGASGLVLALVLAVGQAGADPRGGGNRARANVHDSNRNLNQNVNRNANQNVNVNRNVNQNVNVNRNVNVHVEQDRWGHPVAGAVAATAAVVAIGTVVATLPASGCSGIAVGGVAYQQCGSTYYQPVYRGSSVSYVVVAPP